VDDAALKDSAPDHASPCWRQQHLLRNFGLLLGRVTVSCHLLVICASVAVNRRDLRFAKLSRGLDQGIKHDLQIERRTADSFQHLSGRGLLPERVGEIGGTLLKRVEQAHVLDGDHRLVGKGLQELDLPCTERADFSPSDQDSADRGPFAQQRDS
jgi:hypothetical protein